MQIFLKTLNHALMISAFIFGMMLLVEYFTVQTKYKFVEKISKNIWLQVVIAALLGIIPGCLGTFFAVTLYLHNIINFPALTTVMIATSGDEAYAMLAFIPQKFLLINAILFVVAIVTGFVLNIFYKNKSYVNFSNHLQYHGIEQNCYCFRKDEFKEHMKNISFQRALLITILALLTFFELTGQLGPEQWYFRYSLVGIFLFGLFVVITVPEHFLQKHIWEHITKKHIPRIFLWTLGVLLFLNIFLPLMHISQEQLKDLANKYYWITLLLAVLIGIIPESGPHLVFIILFSKNIVPMSIVIANSISQDGHGSLPLLAESGKSFLIMKLINIFVAALVGVIMHYLGM